MLKMSKLFQIGKIQAEISLDEAEKNGFFPSKNWSLIEIFEIENSIEGNNYSKNKISIECRCEKCPDFSNWSIIGRDILW